MVQSYKRADIACPRQHFYLFNQSEDSDERGRERKKRYGSNLEGLQTQEHHKQSSSANITFLHQRSLYIRATAQFDLVSDLSIKSRISKTGFGKSKRFSSTFEDA
jgi:hypothetical protein